MISSFALTRWLAMTMLYGLCVSKPRLARLSLER
jgi:hypothetical protein